MSILDLVVAKLTAVRDWARVLSRTESELDGDWIARPQANPEQGELARIAADRAIDELRRRHQSRSPTEP
jgi:hypothetical protein